MNDEQEKKKEQELNDFFNMNTTNSQSYEKIVKKARLISTLRSIGITIFVVIFLFVALGFGWLSLMRWNEEKALRDIELFNQITRPNIEESAPSLLGSDMFNGTIHINRYKEIEGTPVDWSDQVFTYSIFGGARSVEGDRQIQIVDHQDEQNRSYDEETKQRMMQFYHPGVNYNYVRNDLHNLKNYPNDTLMEIGLSFDQSYTPNEVRKFLPENVTLKWYWADTYDNVERLKGGEATFGDGEVTEDTKVVVPSFPEISTSIYGFTHISSDPTRSEELFLDDITFGLKNKSGKYYGEYERISNYIKGDKPDISPQEIKILGVVMTGSAIELTELLKVKQIRAAELGVTVNPNK